MKSVSILDYGLGNLLSVSRAFQFFDAKVQFIQTAEEIKQADRLVLPGVGAFSDGMQGLQNLNLIEPLKEYCKQGKPFLGICLGMQLMFSKSHEFGFFEGLNLIEGEVVPIPKVTAEGIPHKIPHIGWNELEPNPEGPGFEQSILKNLGPNPSVYFVHSFRAEPSKGAARLANTFYNGQNICAAVAADNVYGCQFHPEKSGVVGLKIVNNFLNLA